MTGVLPGTGHQVKNPDRWQRASDRDFEFRKRENRDGEKRRAARLLLLRFARSISLQLLR